MLNRILDRFFPGRRINRLLRVRPTMIYGYRHQGIQLKDTRVSNSTVITDENKLKLADNVFIGHFNFIESSNGISIAEGVQITNYISVLTHSSHISIRLYGRQYRRNKDLVGYKTGSVNIGPYTFVGPHSTILPGTNIGKGCIVASYSLVKGDFPDFSIISGNPAVITGDTRELDRSYLDEYPELQTFYNEWAEK